MKIKWFFFSLLFFSCNIGYSQVINITGRVTDQNTNLPIPGASAIIGKIATSTNNNGEFNLVVNKADALQYGIIIKCVGFQRQQIAYHEKVPFLIKLRHDLIALHEVIISASSESILKKAIRKIPENYPDKDFIVEGILRMTNISKDSIATYRYYTNDALIKMYFPSYLNNGDKPKVELIQNKFALLKNPGASSDTVKWEGGYSFVTRNDFVHNRASFIRLNGTKNYTYMDQEKEFINGNRVYVINFFDNNDQAAGTLYIDTASYAFTRITYTRYNVKRFLFVTLDKSSTTVNYKKMNGKWYIDNVKSNVVAKHNYLDLHITLAYKTTLIDLVKPAQISYHDNIQYLTEDIKVNKPGTAQQWLKNKTLFDEAEKDSVFTRIPVPVVDTSIGNRVIKKNLLGRVLSYLRNDNMRDIIQVSRLPLSSIEPLLAKKTNQLSAYDLGIEFQFRLYKELFFQADVNNNFGLGGINNNAINYLLSYNFEFNKQHHPITISPFLGYNYIALSDKSTNFFDQKSIAMTLIMAYEVTHRLSYFGGVNYIDPLSRYTANRSLNLQKIYPSAGIIYKIK